MKKSTIKNFEKMREKRNLSSKAKKSISKRLISNFAICLSFIALILLYYIATFYIKKDITTIIYHVISFIFLVTAIILFEIGYKKDSGKYALTGLEMLIVALFSLFSPHIYYVFNRISIIICLLVMTLYYIVKIIVIYNKEKNKALKEFDDINTIVKKESKDNLAKTSKKVQAKKVATSTTKGKKSPTKKVAEKSTTTKTTTTKTKTQSSKSKASTKNTSAKKATIIPKELIEPKTISTLNLEEPEDEKVTKKPTSKKTTTRTTTTKKSSAKASTASSKAKASTTAKPKTTTTKKASSTSAKTKSGVAKSTTQKKASTTKKSGASKGTSKSTTNKRTTKKGE